MNTATPGTDLPLAGITTARFGPNFTIRMKGRPVSPVIDKMHPDMFLVRATLEVGLFTHPIYIVCEDEKDQKNVALFIVNNEDECGMLVRHQPDGIQFLWMHLGTSRQYAIRAVSR